MSFLFDTNTVSDLLKNNIRGQRIQDRMRAVLPAEVAISVITEAELRYGLARNPYTRFSDAVHKILTDLTIIPWDSNTAMHYGELLAKSGKQGITIGALDLLIASSAKASDRTLITSDSALHRLRPWLTVEDWTN